MKPVDLPDPKTYPHGTRARYVSCKCRCTACRAANTAYYHTVKARGAYVSTARARGHLADLSARGVGYKAVAASSGVAKGLLREIISGARQHIREDTESKILATDRKAAAAGTIVDGRRTRRAINEMLRLGLTKAEIATRLGRTTPALQIKRRRVLARTEAGVLRLLKEIRREVAEQVLIDGQRTHRAIATMLGLGFTRTEIAERFGKRHLALEIKPLVPIKTEDRVLRLLKEIRREIDAHRHLPTICAHCGLSHATTDRHRVLARMLPAFFEDVHAAWPCLYEDTAAGQQRFYRDRRAIQEQP